MSTIDSRTPCIIGVAQQSWRDPGGSDPEPLAMWEQVARSALQDAGVPAAAVDAVHQVHCMSWTYDDGPERLAQRLGLAAGFRETSVLAGTAGQRMVNSASERMLRGESELALVVGGEALATRRQILASGGRPEWSYPSPTSGAPPIDLDEWILPTEWVHEVTKPTVTFAALDAARRAERGLSPADSLALEGELLSRCSEVAAANPHAWFPIRRSAAEITTADATNRPIASPYTKYMVAIMDVDQAACLVLATTAKADELGVPTDQRIYPRGWSFGRDATHLAQRALLGRSEAMAIASSDALDQAGIGIDEVAHLDLYSCFASSLLFATDALGLDPLDPRSLTVTGGLPYAGGPSSNYTTHAIATMVGRLREEESSAYGIVSGVGMHMTKHVWGVYGTAPGPLHPPDYAEVQRQIDTQPQAQVLGSLESSCSGTVGAATVTYDRSGAPESALVIAEVAPGVRTYGRALDPAVVAELLVGESVGRAVTLHPREGGLHEVAEVAPS